MQAYAVMDGGGVKGAALAGCILAAEEAGVQFVGYAGTSAGSIVAMLAAVGYTGAELNQLMTTELRFGDLLQEVKAPLQLLKQLPGDLKGLSVWNAPCRLWKYKAAAASLDKDLGFASCKDFESKLLELVRRKLGNDVPENFNFSYLKDVDRPLLKVVASNLSNRQPIVFSHSDEDAPVLSAIRGSMSYPFIFKPLTLNGKKFVDGGLCSNLPAFVFDDERAHEKLPLIAFDLISPSKEPPSPYGISEFVADLLETALEAGDFIHRQTKEFHRVEIPTPEGIDTLDFSISAAQLIALINAGRAETASFIQNELAPWTQARNIVERLQALYAPADEVRFVLQRFCQQLQDDFGITAVRAAVSLPTGMETRVVVYQYGMDADPDQNLEIAQNAGCSGQCWVNREPTYANLADPEPLGLTAEQQARVRADRKAMLCVPVFDRMSLKERGNPEPPLLGVLSFDTDLALEELGWNAEETDASNVLRDTIKVCQAWSRIITKVLR